VQSPKVCAGAIVKEPPKSPHEARKDQVRCA